MRKRNKSRIPQCESPSRSTLVHQLTPIHDLTMLVMKGKHDYQGIVSMENKKYETHDRHRHPVIIGYLRRNNFIYSMASYHTIIWLMTPSHGRPPPCGMIVLADLMINPHRSSPQLSPPPLPKLANHKVSGPVFGRGRLPITPSFPHSIIPAGCSSSFQLWRRSALTI